MNKEYTSRIIEDVIELLNESVGDYSNFQTNKEDKVDCLLINAGIPLTQGARKVATAVVNAGIYIEKQLGDKDRATAALACVNSYTDYGSYYAEAIAFADQFVEYKPDEMARVKHRLQPSF
jgi:hypothetical protein